MRLRSGRNTDIPVYHPVNHSMNHHVNHSNHPITNSKNIINTHQMYFDYESDCESSDGSEYDGYDSSYCQSSHDDESSSSSNKKEIAKDKGQSDNTSDAPSESESQQKSITIKPYQIYLSNRIYAFLDVKRQYSRTDKYYIELSRAITELYAGMNIYFDDFIHDMYNDNHHGNHAYRILKIANEKARVFIIKLMDELTTSTNRLYNKSQNIKIIHCSLNDMREFVNRVEKHILY